VTVLLGAIACGIGLSVLKGDGEGVRSAVGNLSVPWLLIPFVAGAAAAAGPATGLRRVSCGALVGLIATSAALGGFYVSNSFVLDLGSHPWLVDLHLTVAAGRRYFVLGLLSGPVCGGLGAGWASRGPSSTGGLRRLAATLAALLVLEPVASLVHEATAGGDRSGQPGVWVGELLIGVGVGIWLVTPGSPEGEPASRVAADDPGSPNDRSRAEAYPNRSPLV
jgi:hypothetical protein